MSTENTFEVGDASFYLKSNHMRYYAALNTSDFAVEPICPQTDDKCVMEKNLFGAKGEPHSIAKNYEVHALSDHAAADF